MTTPAMMRASESAATFRRAFVLSRRGGRRPAKSRSSWLSSSGGSSLMTRTPPRGLDESRRDEARFHGRIPRACSSRRGRRGARGRTIVSRPSESSRDSRRIEGGGRTSGLPPVREGTFEMRVPPSIAKALEAADALVDGRRDRAPASNEHATVAGVVDLDEGSVPPKLLERDDVDSFAWTDARPRRDMILVEVTARLVPRAIALRYPWPAGVLRDRDDDVEQDF